MRILPFLNHSIWPGSYRHDAASKSTAFPPSTDASRRRELLYCPGRPTNTSCFESADQMMLVSPPKYSIFFGLHDGFDSHSATLSTKRSVSLRSASSRLRSRGIFAKVSRSFATAESLRSAGSAAKMTYLPSGETLGATCV